MGRMDRYDYTSNQKVKSRTEKNQNIYNDLGA